MKNLLRSLSVRAKLIGVIILFSVVGLVLMVRGNAATFVVSMEAENGTKSGNVAPGLTTGASNQQSVKFDGTATPPPPPPAPAPTPMSMYVTPASGSFAVGSDIVVEVRVHSGTTPVNTAQADLAYSSNLQYVSSDVSGSAFTIHAQNTGGSGAATIALGNITALTGDQLMAKVTFKVLSAGTGTVDVKDSSIALAASNSQNILTTRLDGSYTLQ